MQNKDLTIDGVEIDFHALVSELNSVYLDLPEDVNVDDEGGEVDNYIDVRLQIVDGSWELHTGDSQYDTDHRGYWGYGEIVPNMTEQDIEELAQSLIDECADHFAELTN